MAEQTNATIHEAAKSIFKPWEPAPAFAQPPADQALLQRIVTLASYTARNGPQFLDLIRTKQAGNPEYAFLEGGEGSSYYSWYLYCTVYGVSTHSPLPEGPAPHTRQVAAGAVVASSTSAVAVAATDAGAAVAVAVPNLYPHLPPQPGLPADVDQGFLQVLHALNGSKESIKSSQSWFMACAALATPLAAKMVLYAQHVPDYNRQLHVLYLANDILFSGLSRRDSSTTPDSDPIACAFRPVLGTLLAAAYNGGGKSDQVKEQLSKIVQFWGDRKVFTPQVVTELATAMFAQYTTPRPLPAAPLVATAAVAAPLLPAAATAAAAVAPAIPMPQHMAAAAVPAAAAAPWQGMPVGAYGAPPPYMAAVPGHAAAYGMVPGMGPQGPWVGPAQPHIGGPWVGPGHGAAWAHPEAQSDAGIPPEGAPVMTPAYAGPGHPDYRPPAGVAPAAFPAQYPAGAWQPPMQAEAAEPDPGFDPFSFPPGLIPRMLEYHLDFEKPYTPLTPKDVEKFGLPDPPDMTAFLKTRMDQFYAELQEYRAGMTRADYLDEKRKARRAAGLPEDSDDVPTGARNTHKGPRVEYNEGTSTRNDGSYAGPSVGAAAGLGFGSTSRPGLDDVYNSYRKARSSSYHTAAALRSAVPAAAPAAGAV